MEIIIEINKKIIRTNDFILTINRSKIHTVQSAGGLVTITTITTSKTY